MIVPLWSMSYGFKALPIVLLALFWMNYRIVIPFKRKLLVLSLCLKIHGIVISGKWIFPLFYSTFYAPMCVRMLEPDTVC